MIDFELEEESFHHGQKIGLEEGRMNGQSTVAHEIQDCDLEGAVGTIDDIIEVLEEIDESKKGSQEKLDLLLSRARTVREAVHEAAEIADQYA